MSDTVPETYTLVTLDDFGTYDVLDSPDSIDAQTTKHLDSLRQVDYWVHLTSTDGDPIRVLASGIRMIALCTKAGRARSVLVRWTRDEERRDARLAAGYPPGDEY